MRPMRYRHRISQRTCTARVGFRGRGGRHGPLPSRFPAPPWYYGMELPQDQDLQFLRPPRYDKWGRNHGFETRDECAGRDEANREVLWIGDERCQELGDRLATCGRRHPCGSPACKRCMREFRRAFTGIALPPARQLVALGMMAVFVTIVWDDPALRNPSLRGLDLDRVKQRLRMTLRRIGLGQVPMIGGIDFDWSEEWRVWEPHAHAVAFIYDESDLDPLYGSFRPSNDVPRPVVVQEVRELHAALAYCWKFSPRRKTGRRQAGNGLRRKRGLKVARLREALLWLDVRDPMGFIFLQGIRRVGQSLYLR